MFVARPASSPRRNDSRRELARPSAHSSGTNATQATGNSEKFSHDAATSAPVTSGAATTCQRVSTAASVTAGVTSASGRDVIRALRAARAPRSPRLQVERLRTLVAAAHLELDFLALAQVLEVDLRRH